MCRVSQGLRGGVRGTEVIESLLMGCTALEEVDGPGEASKGAWHSCERVPHPRGRSLSPGGPDASVAL
jgi:hypothetical protein